MGVVGNLSAAVDPTCAGKFPGATWKCLIGEYAVPTISAPYVLHAFQADDFQLKNAFGDGDLRAAQVRDNVEYVDYAESWRTRTRAALTAAIQAGV